MNMSPHHRRFGFLGLLVLALLTTAVRAGAAQITAATLSGTIKDQTGGILPGVDVAVKNTDTGVSRSVVSTADGVFTILGLLPGKYEVKASLQGFNTTVEHVELAVGQDAGLNLTMRVGTTQESVTVTASAILVDTRSSALSALVPEKTIEELPLNGRNYITLATLQPGIINFTEKSGTSSSTRGVQLNINGMGGRSNSFLIDGANMKGYAGIATVTAADSTLGVDTIREFRVVTNAFSADYGRAMGGVVSIATKSGSNDSHGSVFEFFRDSKFDAPNYFDPADASGAKQAPRFKRNQFGASFGGPLRQNKIFFFGGYERLQEDLGLTLITTVPTLAARAGTVNAAVRPYLISIRRRTAPTSAAASPSTSTPSTGRPARTSARDASTFSCRPTTRSSSATRSTRRTSCCRPAPSRCPSSRPIRRRATRSSPPKRNGSRRRRC